MSIVNSPTDITWVKVRSNSTSPIVICAATPGKRVVLVGALLIADTGVNLTVEDSDGTDLIGPVKIGQTAESGGFHLPPSPLGWRVTDSGKGLALLLGSAVYVGGEVGYVLIDA